MILVGSAGTVSVLKTLAVDSPTSGLTSTRSRGVATRTGSTISPRPVHQAAGPWKKNVTSLRFDLFADKSLPQRGPGLNGDGSFQLVELKVTARPLVSVTPVRLPAGPSV